jgi:hypothetical protein
MSKTLVPKHDLCATAPAEIPQATRLLRSDTNSSRVNGDENKSGGIFRICAYGAFALMATKRIVARSPRTI